MINELLACERGNSVSCTSATLRHPFLRGSIIGTLRYVWNALLINRTECCCIINLMAMNLAIKFAQNCFYNDTDTVFHADSNVISYTKEYCDNT